MSTIQYIPPLASSVSNLPISSIYACAHPANPTGAPGTSAASKMTNHGVFYCATSQNESLRLDPSPSGPNFSLVSLSRWTIVWHLSTKAQLRLRMPLKAGAEYNIFHQKPFRFDYADRFQAFRNVSKLNGDTQKYFVIGQSAGGHLALALANKLVNLDRQGEVRGNSSFGANCCSS
ncbi:hypothetical protein BDV06DRAFT_204893 [Aspergillus oleicola]